MPGRFVSVLLLLLFAGAAAAQPAAPVLLSQAVAATQAQKRDFAFDYELIGAGAVGGAAQPGQHWRAHFDPARAAPHLMLVEPQHLEGAQQHAFDDVARRMQGLSWCASADMAHAQNLRLVREDADGAVYAFQPSRNQINGNMGAIAERLQGEMTLTKANPDISNVHMFITQPFSPMLFSSVTRLDIAIHCETAPNGRRYAAQTVMELAGAALGKNFTQHSVTRLSNLTAPP